MNIRANFNERVLVHSNNLPWIKSPISGVDRKPLDRVGQEVARATSIVRYAPGSQFSAHKHDGGEEFIVLSGTFQDEHGDFPVGSYVRNPPQSSHTPSSKSGCIIFVKLWQMQVADREHTRLLFDEITFSNSLDILTLNGDVKEALLFENKFESVKLLKVAPNTGFKIDVAGGAELFILEGEIHEHSDSMRQHSWLRLPPGQPVDVKTAELEAVVWLKTGNVVDARNQIQRVKSAESFK